jgi:hypothetical protein
VGGDGVVAGLGEAKVGDLGAHAGVKEDVAALDVLVILCTTRGQVCSWMYWRPWARSRVTRSSRTRTPGSIHQVAVARRRVDAEPLQLHQVAVVHLNEPQVAKN